MTAERWADILKREHSVVVLERYADEEVDALIALHAGGEADSIQRFRARFPNRPLLVAVTGTDIYGDEFDHDLVTHSLSVADRIIVLQPRTAGDLPKELRSKARVIYQSAEPPARRHAPRPGVFEVAVVGHLRPVKDPFLAAAAARLLDAASTIRIAHLGEALSPEMARQARQEAETNPRYEWLGDMPHEEALALMARCRLLAVTSVAEGGPAVIAEAVVAGVPVVATEVSGCVGMLGGDYPGLFAVGDAPALADLLRRAEYDADFYRSLQAACDRRRPLFHPEAERAAWGTLLVELGFGRIGAEA